MYGGCGIGGSLAGSRIRAAATFIRISLPVIGQTFLRLPRVGNLSSFVHWTLESSLITAVGIMTICVYRPASEQRQCLLSLPLTRSRQLDPAWRGPGVHIYSIPALH